jgi:hypothetical protein
VRGSNARLTLRQGAADTKKPAEMISGNMTGALCVYSLLFMRFAWAVQVRARMAPRAVHCWKRSDLAAAAKLHAPLLPRQQRGSTGA